MGKSHPHIKSVQIVYRVSGHSMKGNPWIVHKWVSDYRVGYMVAIANCLFSAIKHILCCREVFTSTEFNFLQGIIIHCTFHTVPGAPLISVCFSERALGWKY